tara:strand:- start:582 stop:947 length:366 start_codon:yes stop_codon:yes gene_type:complete
MIISKTLVYAGSTLDGYISIPEGARIERCWLMLESTLAAHAVNYLTLNVYGSDGATAIGTSTTNSSGGATLTALTAVELSLTRADLQSYSSGGYIKVEAVKAGTPANNEVVFGIKLAFDRD